jgi:hypothetical protein
VVAASSRILWVPITFILAVNQLTS